MFGHGPNGCDRSGITKPLLDPLTQAMEFFAIPAHYILACVASSDRDLPTNIELVLKYFQATDPGKSTQNTRTEQRP